MGCLFRRPHVYSNIIAKVETETTLIVTAECSTCNRRWTFVREKSTIQQPVSDSSQVIKGTYTKVTEP